MSKYRDELLVTATAIAAAFRSNQKAMSLLVNATTKPTLSEAVAEMAVAQAELLIKEVDRRSN